MNACDWVLFIHNSNKKKKISKCSQFNSNNNFKSQEGRLHNGQMERAAAAAAAAVNDWILDDWPNFTFFHSFFFVNLSRIFFQIVNNWHAFIHPSIRESFCKLNTNSADTHSVFTRVFLVYWFNSNHLKRGTLRAQAHTHYVACGQFPFCMFMIWFRTNFDRVKQMDLVDFIINIRDVVLMRRFDV